MALVIQRNGVTGKFRIGFEDKFLTGLGCREANASDSPKYAYAGFQEEYPDFDQANYDLQLYVQSEARQEEIDSSWQTVKEEVVDDSK